jgi:glycosyltransferase involved in cell wall biosynthesis
MKQIIIVVPAYQCETTIAETLGSLQQQGAALNRVREVIVADDASRDRTRDVAREAWKCQTPPLRILEPPKNRGEYVNVNETVAGLAPDIDWFLIMHGDNDRVGTISTSWDHWRLDGRFLLRTHPSVGSRRFLVRATLSAARSRRVVGGTFPRAQSA